MFNKNRIKELENTIQKLKEITLDYEQTTFKAIIDEYCTMITNNSVEVIIGDVKPLYNDVGNFCGKEMEFTLHHSRVEY